MAEWTSAYINDLPDSSFAYIEPGGKVVDGKTEPRSLRHFPYKDAEGNVDLPHLRNAMARAPQSPFGDKAMPKLKAAAAANDVGDGAGKALLPVTVEPMAESELAAWLGGKRPRELLAIPFYGPIPGPDGKGRDLDGEYFDAASDIKPDWFSERPVDWHHSKNLLGMPGDGRLIGKATDLRLESDGWWVNIWAKAGEARLALIKKLTEQGSQIFGSSWAYPNLIKRGKAGHIDVWPFTFETLSTSPQNIWSTLRPAKAADLFDASEITLDGHMRDLLSSLDNLQTGPASDLTGEDAAKAGRVISSANEQAFQDAIDAFQAFLDSMRVPKAPAPPPKE
jgi:hypothetical protein